MSLLPGGTVNPDQLRMNSDAVRFVKVLVDSDKRSPADLPAFCPAIIEQFSRAADHAIA